MYVYRREPKCLRLLWVLIRSLVEPSVNCLNRRELTISASRRKLALCDRIISSAFASCVCVCVCDVLSPEVMAVVRIHLAQFTTVSPTGSVSLYRPFAAICIE